MPTLNWIGKEAVVDHHRHIPTRLLECDPKLSFGDPDAENLLVEGDNLEALKALLHRYRGQVKCIYIDPPYNTGNENWVYNDNVNDPRIKKWLGQVVGKEAEDLCRHDKWLCMMYPRLALLREFLRDDGAIFVSIDDNEGHCLKLLLDEVFSAANFVACLIWQKKYATANDSKGIPAMHDYVLCYQRSEAFNRHLLPRTAKQDNAYRNPDNDPRGPWKAADFTCNKTRGERPNLYYALTQPGTGEQVFPSETRVWAYGEDEYLRLDKEKRLWWGANGTNSRPAIKKFLNEVQDGIVPNTWFTHDIAGHTDEAKKDLLRVVPDVGGYMTPKPIKLIRRILEIASDKDSIVMDSFAGTGTTGAAVLETNQADGGSRKCVLIEIDSAIASSITYKRLNLLSSGYTDPRGQQVEGLGSGFRFCKLGRTLLDEFGDINGEVPFTDLARYVYLLETGVPIPKRPKKDCPLLGVHQGRAIYLLYNGVLGDRRPAGGNVLTNSVLAGLPPHPEGKGSRIIFGEATRLSESTLARENIVFRQIPYSLRES